MDNQSQLLSEIDSDRSQPKSGNDKRAEIDGAGQKIWPFLGHEWLNDCSVHKNGRFYGQSGGIDGVVHEKGCFHG